jgi:hypothetical protein
MTVTRGRLSFSLRTMFVVVTICGAACYWIACYTELQRAQRTYKLVHAEWTSEMRGAIDVCNASLQLFRAEVGVPFSNRHRAAASHLGRIAPIREAAYGPASEWLMGVAGEASLAEADSRKAEIDRCFNEAQRMASEAR